MGEPNEFYCDGCDYDTSQGDFRPGDVAEGQEVNHQVRSGGTKQIGVECTGHWRSGERPRASAKWVLMHGEELMGPESCRVPFCEDREKRCHAHHSEPHYHCTRQRGHQGDHCANDRGYGRVRWARDGRGISSDSKASELPPMGLTSPAAAAEQDRQANGLGKTAEAYARGECSVDALMAGLTAEDFEREAKRRGFVALESWRKVHDRCTELEQLEQRRERAMGQLRSEREEARGAAKDWADRLIVAQDELRRLKAKDRKRGPWE